MLRLVQAGARAVAPALATGLLLLPTVECLLSPVLAASPSEVLSRSRSSGDLQAGQNVYILGPGDQLSLQILDPGAKDLGGNLEILNDGSASLALLGSVVLEGLTLNQAQAWLTSLYASQMYRPDLILRVVRPRPIQVSLVGEVENPGLYSLTSTEKSSRSRATVIGGRA